MSYFIEQIAQIIGARRIGNVSASINWLLTDSRSLCFPEGTLFFALSTGRGDGARYIPSLLARGVKNFVIGQDTAESIESGKLVLCSDANYLVVPDILKALQKLAEQHRSRFQVPVIGITGSNGKTVVKEWLHQLLAPYMVITRSPRSYNSQIGVPLSVWGMNEQTRLGIFEAGISEPGEMRALQSIIKPTIGIMTNIGGAHQEGFLSMQDKCMEKLSLFKDCEVLIYNGDDEFISNCVARSLYSVREIAWSRHDADRPLYIDTVEKRNDCTVVSYRYLDMENSFTLPFIDDASIENSLNCLAACLYLMLPPQTITERMAHLEPVAMRLELKEGKDGCLLINDSYNSDLMSLDIALDFMSRRAEGHDGKSPRTPLKKTLILSDMLETGQNVPVLYRQVAQLVANRGVERIIGVGKEISSNESRFAMEKDFYPDTPALTHAIKEGKLHLKDEIVLIKGAREFGFDVLTEMLEKKVHETILEINLGAIIANLDHYRSMLSPGVKLMCMVKASAYGAGACEVARTLQEHRVDYLAVAVADEGCDLRRAGITANIIIMNPETTAFKMMLDNCLEPEVYSFRLLDALAHEVKKQGITGYPVHIKIDTGMHRLGFRPEDIPRLVERLKAQDALMVRSVFSHLVGSDSPHFDDFTRRQIALFEVAAAELQAAFPHKILRHISNSAAIGRFPEAAFDMVRLGIGLYGINPVDNTILHNVSSLFTTILQIHDVPQEDTVGYGRKGHLSRPSRIATLPIGYADGLNRRLGNGRAYCIVNGKKAPYVGNICMDVCMIDVTGIDCQEGDRVEIFGEHLPVTVLSDTLDTIPYEVLTSVSTRVKRVYYQE